MIDITRPLMILMRDGVEISRHTSAVEAMGRAASEGPGEYTLVRPDATITVKGAQPEPKPEPEPDPEPEPEPELPADPRLQSEYLGGCRLENGVFSADGRKMRASNGSGALCVVGNRVWVSSHKHFYGVGAFGPLKFAPVPQADMPIIPNSVPFSHVEPEPADQTMQIQGIYDNGAELLVTYHAYYDAGGGNNRSLAVLNRDGSTEGFFPVTGNAHAAGWIHAVPEKWQAVLQSG